MYRSSLLSFSLLLSSLATGCLGSSVMPDAGEAGITNPFPGGSLMLASCGYSVTTREGATAPVMSSAMLGANPTPRSIHLGLASDPSTTMAVTWRTMDDTTLAATVQWGTGATPDQSTDGVTFTYSVAVGTQPLIHQAHMCGLKPDTVYNYRVGGKDGAGKEAWSPIYSFHTAPPKTTTSSITVGIIGDTRLGETTFGPMLALLQKNHAPDVILFSGDATLFGEVQAEWETWFDAAEPVLHSVPIVTCMGNHEDNSINYYSQFVNAGDGENFSLDYGPMHVTVLNDSPARAMDWSAATAFLTSDLAASDKAPWKFLLHHQPMFSSAVAHGSNLTLRGLWEPLVDMHHVDMVFNGHDHDYERTHYMNAAQQVASPTAGTTYMVVGSAGAELYPNGMDPVFTLKSSSIYNYSVLRLSVGNMDMKAYDMSDTVIDMLAYTK